MSLVGLIASIVILAMVILDWRRGKTGFGRLSLTKDKSPERFWLVIALYINMALALFWLSGTYSSQGDGCDPGSENCVVIIMESTK